MKETIRKQVDITAMAEALKVSEKRLLMALCGEFPAQPADREETLGNCKRSLRKKKADRSLHDVENFASAVAFFVIDVHV